jgi:hypothetical protein
MMLISIQVILLVKMQIVVKRRLGTFKRIMTDTRITRI